MTETVPTRERFLQVALLGGGLTLLSGVTVLGPREPALPFGAALKVALVLLPLVPLLGSLARLETARRVASVGLLVGVPVAVALGVVASPARLDPIVFCVRAATLVAYLVQSARLLASPIGAAPVVLVNPLPAVRERLLRRDRFYGVFVVLSVLAFVVPLGRALTARGAALPAFAAAALLAVLACRAFLVDPLDRHLHSRK